MSLIKSIAITGVMLIIAFMAYKIWQPSPAQYEDYRALLCLAIQNQQQIDQKQILEEMDKIHKHSYPEYALQKPEFKQRYARKIWSQFQQLGQTEQNEARNSIMMCEKLLIQ